MVVGYHHFWKHPNGYIGCFFFRVASEGGGVAGHILYTSSIHLCVRLGSFNNSLEFLEMVIPTFSPGKTTKNAETKNVLLTLETWKEVLEFPSFFRFTLDT